MTAMRGKRACPTSLHQTSTSRSWVMSDPSVFFPITALVWIAGIWSQSCISSLVLSASDVCGDLPPDGTVCTGDTILHNKRQQSDVVQSLSVRSTRGRRERLTCCARESWTWRCLQILLKPSESMRCSLRLVSMHLLQQNRQPPAPQEPLTQGRARTILSACAPAPF